MDVALYAVIGINLFILGVVFTINARVGKLEGRLKNGDFLRCPFYRGNKGCKDGEGTPSNTKTKGGR